MKNKSLNRRGSTLLIVVIVMSITFIMAGIVFSYAMRTYRLMNDSHELIQAEALVETGIYDAIMIVSDMLDNGETIEEFELANHSVYDEGSDYYYNILISEDGSYNVNDYLISSNKKHFLVKRVANEVDGELEELSDVDVTFAIKVEGKYKTTQKSGKRIIHIFSNEEEYYEIIIYICYDRSI